MGWYPIANRAGRESPRRKDACSFLQYGGDAAPEDCHAVAQPQGSLLWEENISDSEALKWWIPFSRGAQIELSPYGPNQVILLTESGSRLAED